MVLAKLGAQVTATDLAPNLALLEKNAAANSEWLVDGVGWAAGKSAGRHSTAAWWGHVRGMRNTRCLAMQARQAKPLQPPSPSPHPSPTGCAIVVKEHSWGSDTAPLVPPFDVVAACDVMYVVEAVAPLVTSLVALAGPGTEVYISHGRNRQASAARAGL